MKSFIENKIIKKILIVFISIIMVSNFIMPNYVCAKDPGKQLVSGFFYLLSYVGDSAISLMQKIMVGDGDIESGGKYTIQYSPGMIFSDKVAGLKVNFISAKESDKTTVVLGTDPDSKAQLKDVIGRMNKKMKEDRLFPEYIGQFVDSGKTGSGIIWFSEKGNDLSYDLPGTTFMGTQFVDYNGPFINVHREWGNWKGIADDDVDEILDEEMDGYYLWCYSNYLYLYTVSDNGGFDVADKVGDNEFFKVYRYNLSAISSEIVEKDSIAYELQNNIAKWYTVLRTFALAGLLSVLVYVGIRIILSSTSAQNQAKYKNMLKDWLVAICILFVLHYVMVFMLDFTSRFNEIIENNIIEVNAEGNQYDRLMSTVRNKYEASAIDAEDPTDTAGYTVMYLALVILTGVFTFQYLKRVIYMAFLTMIAPMIALTYPLDKIKDGKAQAFSFWLKEYIFNCLIQPVHLLLYTILIANAIDFATENMLYAIVALAFLVPAEKFVKQMFGIKSESPVGQLGAAAGGAMVMSMLNKIKSKPPKGGAEGAGSGASGSAKGVRTATRNGGSSSAGTGGAEDSTSPSGSSSSSSGGRSSSGSGGGSGSSTSSSSSPSMARGLGRAGRSLAIKGVDGLKSAGIGVMKKAPGAVLGATVGLAATVASGGENALSFIGGGAAAGSALTSNIASGVSNFTKDSYAEYQKGKFGEEAYQNRKFDKEFYKSEGYRMIAEDSSIQSFASRNGVSVQEVTQQFLDNGITDSGKIREALQKEITGDEYKAYSKAGIENTKKMSDLKKKYTPEQVASRVALAKNAPKTLRDFKAMMVGRTFDGNTVTAKDAEKIYKELVDFF